MKASIKVMLTLVKRECREHKKLFFYLPLVITMFFCFFIIIKAIQSYISGVIYFDSSTVEGLIKDGMDLQYLAGNTFEYSFERFSELPMASKESLMSIFFYYCENVFLVYWLTILFYFVLTLYQERKDKSILFWKSLPVSDTQSILSKLIVALILLPGIYLICLVVIDIFTLLTLSVRGLAYDVNIWQTFWRPAHVFSRWLGYMITFLLSGLWCLPIYGWSLLVSAWARSIPFAYAGGPVLIIVFGLLYFNSPKIPVLFFEHTMPIWLMEADNSYSVTTVLNYFNVEMLISVLLGCMFFFGAILVRKHTEEL